MAKKEKKIPAKQQYYEQIISKQLYGAPPTREEGIAKLQADYDAWNQRQEGIAKLQADYDAWRKAQQPVEQPKAEMPKVEKAETPKAERQKSYAELHPESIPKSISYDEIFGKKKNVEVKAPEEKVYKTHADIIPSLTKANVEKQKKKEQNKEQSIAKIAKQLGITEEEVKERMKEPTPKTAFKAPNESTLKSADKKVEKEALQKYLDPNKKLSKQEKREAKELLKQIKEEQGNKIKNTKGATPEQIEKAKDLIMTPEEQEISKLSEDLSTKLNPVYSMIEGIVSPYRRIAKAPDKALNKLESKIRYGEAQIFDALGVTQNAKEEALRKNAESLTELENEQERMDNLVSAATTQNPIPTTAGKLGGTLSQYYFTNGIFDAAAGALGATSAAGKFAANQLGQNAQDLVLDTLPQYKEFMSDGYLSPEEEKELKLNAAINIVGNAIPGLIGYAGESAKAAKATAESNEAFRKNALEGYEKLKALNAEDAAKQAEIPNMKDFTKNSLDDITNKRYGDVVKNDISTKNGGVDYETINRTGNQGNVRPEEPQLSRTEVSGSVDSGRTYSREDGRTLNLRDVVSEDLSKRMDEAGINNFGLQDVSNNPEAFSQQLADAKYSNKNGRMVSSQNPEDLKDAILYSDKAGTCGVAIEPNGNIVAVHKNSANMKKGAVDDMLLTARANGGDRLDCYGRGLVRKYEQDGFKPVAKVEWNEKFKPEDWGDNPPEEIFVMMKDSRTNEQVIDDIKNGTFKVSTPEELDALPTYSLAEYGDAAYDEALKYRDNLIDMDLQKFAEKQPEKGAFLNAEKNADDLWDELSGGAKPETSVRTSEMNERGQKLSKLHSTLQNTETLTDAEKQVYADKNGFWYDPDIERVLADNSKKEIENIGVDEMYNRYMSGDLSGKTLTAQDNHNMFTTSFDYNRMAQEALQNGDTEAAKLYSSKARNIMLKARETGTSYGQFNAATAFYARTPQGYVDKAYQKLSDQISNFKSSKPKLSGDIDNMAKRLADDLKDVDIDGIMAGSDEAAKDSLRQRVLDNIEDYLKTANKQTKKTFSNLSPSELDDIIAGKYQEDLARNLDMFAMGSFGVKPETVDKVMEIFAEAEKYNINSKQYYDLEKQAFDLLANDLNNGKSFGEKFDTWRYFAMLSNPLTHVKNMGGNLNNKVLVGTKNSLAALIEAGADKVAKANGGIEGGRTKALLNVFNANDKALMEGAGKHFDDYAYREFKQAGNKWIDVGRELENAGDIFNGNNKLGRGLNKITKGNENILDAEDILAGKATYQTSLAGFLKANGADASIFTKTDDASRELLEQGKNYALQQANEATFHQKNELAQRISNFIKEGKHSDSTAVRALSRGLDFMVPFVKTPSNILRACYEYSPLEFLSVAKETKAWKDGAVSTAKYIDDISKGITGSMGVLLGGLLVESGILKVSSGDDTEDSFDKKRGNTSPSIKVGNASLKISELVPGAMPLIIGATVWETIKNSKKSTDAAFDTFFNGIAAIGDSVTDMTMLSGIASTLNDIRYAKTDADLWGQLGMGIASNAAGQILPTVGRKIEQTIDDTARSTYSGQQGKFLRSLDSDAKYWKTKIPGLQELGEGLEKSKNQHIKNIGDFLTNEPQINAWGEEIKNADYNLGKVNSGLGYLGRGVHNTVDLFDTQIDSSNKLDNELKNIYHATDKDGNEIKDENVLKYGMAPSTSEATVDGQRMTEKQWTQYQKDSGRMKKELLESFMSSKGYSETSTTDKAETLSKLQSFVKAYNQNKIAGKELSSENQQLAELYDKGNIDNVVSFIRTKAALTEAGIDGRSKEAKEAKEAALSGDAEAVNEVIEKTSKANELYNKYNLADDSDAPTVYSKAGEDGLKYYSELKTQGLTNYKAAVTYYNATKEANGSPIPSIKDYATTYKKIDGLIKANGHVDQDEFIAYLNSGGYTEEEARRLASIYGDWKNPPRRYKKKAGWTFDK